MKGGRPDVAKGSYYANPVEDVVTDNQQLKDEFPETYCDNIWPTKHCPGFESAFKEVGQIQVAVGKLMCKHFDNYLHQLTSHNPSDLQHQPKTLQNMMRSDIQYKGRLLHYYPMEEKFNKDIDGLCGWHLDHGAVTILLSPFFYDLKGEKV